MQNSKLTLLFIFLLISPLFPQQIKTIDTAGVGDFKSFQEAVTYLNQLPAIPEGGIIFQITAAQSFIEKPDTIQATGVFDRPIIFQKIGAGENPIIEADSVRADDGVIFIYKSAFITFDGIDVTDHHPADARFVEAAYYIYASTNITIKNCRISDFNRYGIFVRDASREILITNNEVYHSDEFAIGGTTVYGIYVAFDSEANQVTITKNKVFGLKYASSTVYGIRVFKVTSTIANNFIALTSDGNDKIFALRIDGGDNITFHVYHNSVYLSGASTDHGYALNTTGGSASTHFNIKNNLFINNRTDNDQMAVWASFDAGNFDMDYNLYYCGNENNHFLGQWYQNSATSFADWKSVAKGDSHSVNQSVEFANALAHDLHLAGSSLGDFNLAGIPIGAIPDDIDGDPRSAYSPYLGADEAASHPLIAGIYISPKSISFGYQKIGSSSESRSFVIHNPGTAILTIASISAPEGFKAKRNNSSDWLDNISSFTIYPKDSTLIDVRFEPQRIQVYQNNIVIQSNDRNEPVSYVSVSGQSFKVAFNEIQANLQGAYLGACAWGDYDGDNNLDILLTGYGKETGQGEARVFENQGSKGFVDINAALMGVGASFASWVDFDNDGDLDIFLSGQYQTNNFISKIYQNNAGKFTDINAGIFPLTTGSADWGDYDRDGDLDLLQTGKEPPDNPHTYIYKNEGDGKFRAMDAGLPHVSSSDAKWGDYDNDGDLDIALTGRTASENYISMILRNDGGNLFVDIGAKLSGLRYGNVNWGDYDYDGDLDLLLGGSFANEIPSVAEIYRNDGNDRFTNIHANILGVRQGDLDWGDLDNDGDLDIIMNGIHTNERWIGYIYLNNGADDFILADSLVSLKYAQISLGDFDGDCDLDILLAGRYDYQDYRCLVFENQFEEKNTPPTAPKNLTVEFKFNKAIINWEPAADTETAASGLTYNLRIGTAPGKSDFLNCQSNPQTGYLLIPKIGNMGTSTHFMIPLLRTKPFYFSVQAIDNSFVGSPFSDEVILQVSSVEQEHDDTHPTQIFLGRNYPNPFNANTRIDFGLTEAGPVAIKLYNINGQFIMTFLSEKRKAGYHSVIWDGKDENGIYLPSGIYFYEMTVGDFKFSKKMILAR